jgi:hypothetical protein
MVPDFDSALRGLIALVGVLGACVIVLASLCLFLYFGGAP